MNSFQNFCVFFSPSPEQFGRRTSRRAISFDPSENLENSKYKGDKSESCFSCSCLYAASASMVPAYVYPYRCELIFILTFTGIPGPSG